MQIVSVQGNQHKEKQERDAQRCDRVKVLRYTNSLGAFQKSTSCLTLHSLLHIIGCEWGELGIGIL